MQVKESDNGRINEFYCWTRNEHLRCSGLRHSMDRFRYHNLSRSGRDLSDIRLTVDTEEDFERFSRMAAGLGRPWHDVSYEDAVEFLASEEVHT